MLFIAAIAALGVSARGWKEWRGSADRLAPLPGDRAGLARQIEAVDSAIAVGGARRRASTTRERSTPLPRVRRSRTPAGVGADGMSDAAPDRPSRSRTPRAALALPPTSIDPHEAYRRRWEQADAERRAINERDGFLQGGPTRRRSSPGVGARTRGPPLGARPPVDLDTAPYEEVASIPQIGPGLARRIVTDRIERGPFGSIVGLERVRGVGRALGRRLQPYVTFSLASRLDDVPQARASVRKRRRR